MRRLRPHLAHLRASVDTAAGWWIWARMLVLSLLVSLLKHLVSMRTLVRLIAENPGRLRPNPVDKAQTLKLAHWLCSAAVMQKYTGCLERSVVAYRFLSRVDPSSCLMVGIRKKEGVVQAHAWVTLGQEPVGESSSTLEGFAPLMILRV